jgi:hypothetical protein
LIEPFPRAETDEGVLWPAAPEEGEVGDETTPVLAYHGASKEGGRGALDVEEDFADDVVWEHCRRVLHLSSICVIGDGTRWSI